MVESEVRGRSNSEIYRKSQRKLRPEDWRDAVYTAPMAAAASSFVAAGVYAVWSTGSFFSVFSSHKTDIGTLESFVLSADASPAYRKVHAIARALAFVFQVGFCIHLYRNM